MKRAADTLRIDTAPRFGRYRALFPIASGGMAQVWAAADEEAPTGRHVAVKTILEELASDDRFVRLFLEEARISTAIRSPHVVSVIEVSRDARGLPYIVMELVVGGNLTQLRRSADTALPTSVCLEVGAAAARGLHEAHQSRDAAGRPLRIVHRDVSPQNILIDASGRVRIADFGIAHAARRLADPTRIGELRGKFGYLSPEQVRGHCDARSDVFALGIVLWEQLAGRALFTASSSAETLRRVLDLEIPELAAVNPEVPRRVSRIVRRALERDPARRHESADALASELTSAQIELTDLDPRAWLASAAKVAAGPLVTGLQLGRKGPGRRRSARLAVPVALPGRALDPTRAVHAVRAVQAAPPKGPERQPMHADLVEAWSDLPSTTLYQRRSVPSPPPPKEPSAPLPFAPTILSPRTPSLLLPRAVGGPGTSLPPEPTVVPRPAPRPTPRPMSHAEVAQLALAPLAPTLRLRVEPQLPSVMIEPGMPAAFFPARPALAPTPIVDGAAQLRRIERILLGPRPNTLVTLAIAALCAVALCMAASLLRADEAPIPVTVHAIRTTASMAAASHPGVPVPPARARRFGR